MRCRCRRCQPRIVRGTPAVGDGLLDLLLRTAQVRQAVDVLGKLSHSPPRQPVLGARSRPGKALASRSGLWLRSPPDATDPCRRWACHGLVGGPAGPGSTDPSPRGRSGGVPPAQLPPAATPASRQAHRPLLLGPSGPSSPPWLATAGPAPPPTARCHAPDTAAHHGCRTTARSCGKPGSANRRSAGYTDRGCQAWASTCSVGPCRTPSRAGWRSPRAGGSSGHSRGVTALAWLPSSDQPTKRTGTAKSEPHRGSTVLPRRSDPPSTV